MYVLINTKEELLEIPNSWRTKIISLLLEPRIVSKLPDDTVAGMPVNKREFVKGYYSYDYYVDCRDASEYVIGRALKAFAKKIKSNLEPGEVNPIINPQTYPQENPLVELFKKTLQEKMDKYSKLKLFGGSHAVLVSDMVPSPTVLKK